MLTYEQASDKVIIALDCSRERAFELADMLAGKATWVKVGMTLFYAEGPAIVEAMRERGLRVFLDLKVHDIPFQVQGAVRSAAMTGADIISIRMFVTDQQEALVGFQKIHGLLLADLFGVVHCKAHSFTSSL